MQEPNDYSADYKALSILVTALMAGIVLFSLVATALHYFGGMSERFRDPKHIVFPVVLIIAAAIIIAGRAIYSKRVNTLKETRQSPRAKLDIYRGITITHAALCEFPALLSVICFLVLGDFLFFLIVLMALIEMWLKFPTRENIDAVIDSATF